MLRAIDLWNYVISLYLCCIYVDHNNGLFGNPNDCNFSIFFFCCHWCYAFIFFCWYKHFVCIFFNVFIKFIKMVLFVTYGHLHGLDIFIICVRISAWFVTFNLYEFLLYFFYVNYRWKCAPSVTLAICMNSNYMKSSLTIFFFCKILCFICKNFV